MLRHDTLTEHHSKKCDEMSVFCDPYLSSKVRSRCVICQPQLPLSLDYLRIKRELDEATKLQGGPFLRDVNAQSRLRDFTGLSKKVTLCVKTRGNLHTENWFWAFSSHLAVKYASKSAFWRSENGFWNVTLCVNVAQKWGFEFLFPSSFRNKTRGFLDLTAARA